MDFFDSTISGDTVDELYEDYKKAINEFEEHFGYGPKFNIEKSYSYESVARELRECIKNNDASLYSIGG